MLADVFSECHVYYIVHTMINCKYSFREDWWEGRFVRGLYIK